MSQRHEAFEAMLDYPRFIKGGRVAARWLSNGKIAVTTKDGDYVLSPDGTLVAAPVQPAGKHPSDEVERRLRPESFRRPSFYGTGFIDPSVEMLSPDGRWFASMRDYNVWLRSSVDGGLRQLTFDGAVHNSWDVESTRFGVGAGMQFVFLTTNPWAPDSLHLFATKFDNHGLDPFLRTHWNAYNDAVEAVHFVRAGRRLPTTEPFVIDTLSRHVVRLQTDIDDRFLLLLGWSTDAAAVYFVQFSRDFHWGGVFEADPITGRTRLLFEERGETFIRIQHEVISGRSGCALLPDGQGFLWESFRSGWKHLYHYDLEGNLIRQVTSGDWPIADLLGIDSTTSSVYFTAHHDVARPYDIHLCRAQLSGEGVDRLTEETGVHEVQMAPEFSTYIDTVSRPDFPPQSTLRTVTGSVVRRFDPADISEIAWTFPEEFKVKAADGETDLFGVIYKPADFDPTQRYPVIEGIYGGPQIANVAHHFPIPQGRMWALNYALPKLGYVVVMLDARGTPGRSKRFQDVVFKDWRRHVTADHAAALRGLARDRKWMDLDRVGIWGHSWGGDFTVANLIDNPDLYRAGIASASAFNSYDSFLYEPYLDGPPTSKNKTAYDDAMLILDAPRIVGELMIVAGTNDICAWQNAMHMTRVLMGAGKAHEFVALPGAFHSYTGEQETYFIEKLVSFFDRTVKNAPPSP